MPAVTGVPDAMSDVLSLVRMRAEVVCANEYSAPWSFSFPRPIAHFHIVERGAAWLTVDQREPIRLETGDLAILPLGAGHVLGNDPGVPPVPIDEAMRSTAVRHGAAVYQLGGGGERTHVLCGRFSFEGVLAPKLLAVLQPPIHIETRSGTDARMVAADQPLPDRIDARPEVRIGDHARSPARPAVRPVCI